MGARGVWARLAVVSSLLSACGGDDAAGPVQPAADANADVRADAPGDASTVVPSSDAREAAATIDGAIPDAIAEGAALDAMSEATAADSSSLDDGPVTDTQPGAEAATEAGQAPDTGADAATDAPFDAGPVVPTVQIARSLRFDGGYLYGGSGVAGNRQTTTFSAWVKRSGLGTAQTFLSAGKTNPTTIGFDATDHLRLQWGAGNALTTNAQFRDIKVWLHVVLAIDTTAAIAEDRVKLSVDGVAQSLTGAFPVIDTMLEWNAAGVTQYLGTLDGGQEPLSGYLADVFLIDGVAHPPSAFGARSAGRWSPIAYVGTFGQSGFHLEFTDSSSTSSNALGKDSSGLDHDYTPISVSAADDTSMDSMFDVPTRFDDNGRPHGNYCTLNPADRTPGGMAKMEITDGNLRIIGRVGNGTVGTTCPITSGTYSWAVDVVAGHTASNASIFIGVATSPPSVSGVEAYQAGSNAYLYSSFGKKYANGVSSSYGTNYTNTSKVRVVLDASAGTLSFFVGSQSLGTAFTGLVGPFYPVIATSVVNNSILLSLDTGQRANVPGFGMNSLCF